MASARPAVVSVAVGANIDGAVGGDMGCKACGAVGGAVGADEGSLVVISV